MARRPNLDQATVVSRPLVVQWAMSACPPLCCSTPLALLTSQTPIPLGAEGMQLHECSGDIQQHGSTFSKSSIPLQAPYSVLPKHNFMQLYIPDYMPLPSSVELWPVGSARQHRARIMCVYKKLGAVPKYSSCCYTSATH